MGKKGAESYGISDAGTVLVRRYQKAISGESTSQDTKLGSHFPTAASSPHPHPNSRLSEGNRRSWGRVYRANQDAKYQRHRSVHCISASPSIRTSCPAYDSHAVTLDGSGAARNTAYFSQSAPARISRRVAALWPGISKAAFLEVPPRRDLVQASFCCGARQGRCAMLLRAIY